MKSVKEWVEISCISLQSSRSSFRKIQIFCTSLFYSLFRLKLSLHWVVYTKSVKESKQISCILLQSSKRLFRKNLYRFLNLHILHFLCFIPCLGLKSSLHRVVYAKSVKESEQISCMILVTVFEALVLQNTDFLHFSVLFLV